MNSTTQRLLRQRLARLEAQHSKLYDQYDEAIETITVVQHSFGSSEGSTSQTYRSPEQIMKQIEDVEAVIGQLTQRLRQGGVTTMALRRNQGGYRRNV